MRKKKYFNIKDQIYKKFILMYILFNFNLNKINRVFISHKRIAFVRKKKAVSMKENTYLIALNESCRYSRDSRRMLRICKCNNDRFSDMDMDMDMTL